jgi:hypothetical protein
MILLSKVICTGAPPCAGIVNTSCVSRLSRTKAIFFPSGENTGHESPRIPLGGNVRTRFSRVSRESKETLEGSSGEFLSANTKYLPSGDQSISWVFFSCSNEYTRRSEPPKAEAM